MARLPLVLALGTLMLACGRIQAYEQQLRAAEQASAARPRPLPVRSQAARTLHVRAYADADYIAEHANWRADIAEVVETANLLLEPQLAVALVLDGSREWQRECDTRDKAACLDELARLDEGAADVWVVAFTSARPQLSREHDALAHGEWLGRHVLVHGMSRLDEQDGFDMTTGELREAQRQALEQERARHKAALSLLHAWAHTLGGLHGGDASTVMHPSYAPEQAAFTRDTKDLLSLMIDGGARGDTESSLRAAYRVWLEAHPEAFASDERARRLAELQSAGPSGVLEEASAPELAAADDPAILSLTAEDRELLAQALERAHEGKRDVALASAAQLAERYPDVAPVQLFACDLGLETSCTRAREVTRTAQ